MIVLVMILILIGSAAGTAVMALQDAPWWQIALGYVGGGWVGLVVGLPGVVVAGRFTETRGTGSPAQRAKRQANQQKTLL